MGQGVGSLTSPSNAEVRHPGPLVLPHENVGRLEVTMNQPRRMGGDEALSGLQEHIEDRVPAPLGGREPLAESSPHDQLHRHEHVALELPHIENNHDVGVSQPGRRPSFSNHPSVSFGVASPLAE